MTARARRKVPIKITSYTHPPTEPSTQEADPELGNYYVSMKRGERVALLAGPFRKHQEALDCVPMARGKAHEVDPWSAFDSFGTVRMVDSYMKPGVLNDLLGVRK